VALIGGFLGESYLNLNARNMMAGMNDATRVMEEIRRQNTRNPDGSYPVGSLCATAANVPSARPPPLPSGFCPSSGTAQCESWNEWFDHQPPGQGKSLARSGDIYEIVTVTCQNGNAAGTDLTLLANYCGSAVINPPPGFRAQMGRREWYPWSGPNGDAALTNGHLPTYLGFQTDFNPIRVTVAVGWAQKRQGTGTFSVGASSPEFTYKVALSGKGTAVEGVKGEQLLVGPDIDNDGVIESPAMLTTMVTCR